jgi:hypothetical protein
MEIETDLLVRAPHEGTGGDLAEAEPERFFLEPREAFGRNIVPDGDLLHPGPQVLADRTARDRS